MVGNGGVFDLPEFVDFLNQEAVKNSWLSGVWWRPATMSYHWYSVGGIKWSDFYKGYHVPDLMVLSGEIGGLENPYVDFSSSIMIDRYGRRYIGISASPSSPLGEGLSEFYEGYVENGSGSKVSKDELRNILEGFDIGFTFSTVSMGAGGSVSIPSLSGGVALFGGFQASLGLSTSVSYSYYLDTLPDYEWNSILQLPAFGPEVEGR
jgi:hypothetical protein